MSSLDARSARAWVVSFATAFEEHRPELTELDRLSGDGDFGNNLSRPLERAVLGLDSLGEDATVAEVFDVVSGALMRAGGTSGPLFGAFFRAFGRAGKDAIALGTSQLAEAVTAGTEAVQRLGGAAVGDSTMVDALVPATVELRAAAEAGNDLAAALDAAAVAARTAAQSTSAMTARKGRASYVGDAALGVADPGAVTVALFFESALGVVKGVPR